MLKFEPFDYTTMDLPSDLQLGSVGTPGLFFEDSEAVQEQACDASDQASEAETGCGVPDDSSSAFGVSEDPATPLTTLCCLDVYSMPADLASQQPQSQQQAQQQGQQQQILQPQSQAPIAPLSMTMMSQAATMLQAPQPQQCVQAPQFDLLSTLPLGGLAQAAMSLPSSFQNTDYALPLSLASLAAPLTPPPPPAQPVGSAASMAQMRSARIALIPAANSQQQQTPQQVSPSVSRSVTPSMTPQPQAQTQAQGLPSAGNAQGQGGDQAKPFACRHEGCTARFASDRSRKRHEKAHAGDRPFQCPYAGCPRRFARRSDLTVHERVHTGERPYACEAPGCGKRFTRSSDLRIHERIHGEERPYACAVPGCCATFKRRSDLRKHDRVHTQHPSAAPTPAAQSQMYGGGCCSIDAAAAAVAAAGMIPQWVVKQEPVSFEVPEPCSMGIVMPPSSTTAQLQQQCQAAQQQMQAMQQQQQQQQAQQQQMLPLKLGFGDFF